MPIIESIELSEFVHDHSAIEGGMVDGMVDDIDMDDSTIHRVVGGGFGCHTPCTCLLLTHSS